MFGADTWEAAESTLQKQAATLAIGKAGLKPEEIRMIFAGDLLAQTIASSFGIAELGVPFYGLYGACSTMGESLSLGSMAIAAGYGEHILCATSSHFASAEKEFRYPLGYGCQRPCPLPGQLPEAEPVSSDASLHYPRFPETHSPSAKETAVPQLPESLQARSLIMGSRIL